MHIIILLRGLHDARQQPDRFHFIISAKLCDIFTRNSSEFPLAPIDQTGKRSRSVDLRSSTASADLYILNTFKVTARGTSWFNHGGAAQRENPAVYTDYIYHGSIINNYLGDFTEERLICAISCVASRVVEIRLKCTCMRGIIPRFVVCFQPGL